MSHRLDPRYPRGSLSPSGFALELAREVGTPRGKALLTLVMMRVTVTGEPDDWIREVQRARDAGIISPAVARFLIFKFVDVAMPTVSETHPRIARIAAEIDRIEREHGLEGEEFWYRNEGPPEWQALNREYATAQDEVMAEIFLRHNELELAANPQAEGDFLYYQGWKLLCPSDDD